VSENLGRDDAVQALDEIRTRQRQVVESVQIPDWYWSAVAALVVVFSIGIESRRPVLIGMCTTLFVLGLNATLWIVIRRSRAQVRPVYLGGPGALWIAGFVVVLVAVALAAGFGLAALGFRWPATGGNTVAAIGVALGGPWLMRHLRRVMARRADAALPGGRAGAPAPGAGR
jgi:hypothetical protein